MKHPKLISKDWKKDLNQFLIVAGIFISGVILGMTLTRFEALKEVLVNVLSGLITQAPWFILIYIGFVIIGKAIGNLGKNIPNWIEDFYKRRMNLLRIEKAVNSR
jgi:hypothetical protein